MNNTGHNDQRKAVRSEHRVNKVRVSFGNVAAVVRVPVGERGCGINKAAELNRIMFTVCRAHLEVDVWQIGLNGNGQDWLVVDFDRQDICNEHNRLV